MKKYFIIAIFLFSFFLVGVSTVEAFNLDLASSTLMLLNSDLDNDFGNYSISTGFQEEYGIAKFRSNIDLSFDNIRMTFAQGSSGVCSPMIIPYFLIEYSTGDIKLSNFNGVYSQDLSIYPTFTDVVFPIDIGIDILPANTDFYIGFEFATSSTCTKTVHGQSQRDPWTIFDPFNMEYVGDFFPTSTDPFVDFPSITIPFFGEINWLIFPNQDQMDDLHADYNFLSTKAPFGYFAKIYEILEATSTSATSTLQTSGLVRVGDDSFEVDFLPWQTESFQFPFIQLKNIISMALGLSVIFYLFYRIFNLQL